MGDVGQLGNQEELSDLTRKRLPSRGSNSITMKSRVMREYHARFCERLVVKFHRPTYKREPRRRNIDAPEDGGSSCSSVEVPVMGMEPRGRHSKRGDSGQLVYQDEPFISTERGPFARKHPYRYEKPSEARISSSVL